jgi:serine/threonine-protein kinase RsbW
MSGYTFPAKFEYLDEIRDLVADTARGAGFSEKTIYSLQLAADEAASNIIEHAYKGVKNATIYITCDYKDNQIIITMLDTGKAFDSKTVREPNLTADLAKRQIGGLGVYLMRKLMDTVDYESSKSGNLLTMTKRRE